MQKLQQIVSERAGATGSLLKSFSQANPLAAVGAQKLPEAPAVKGPTQSEPASKPPQAGGGRLPSPPPLSDLGSLTKNKTGGEILSESNFN